MLAGSRRLAAALTFTIAGVVQAQTFEYAPGSATYRVTQTTKTVQEMMGQKQEIEGSGQQIVSVKLTRSARDTISMNVVLDSISATTMGMSPNLTHLVGLTVAAKVSPVGAFYSVRASDDKGGAEAEPIRHAMGNMLPKLRPTMPKGASWTDTTSGTMNQGGVEIERKIVSTYTVEGDTTIGGQPSWKIHRADSTTMSGSGNTPNGAVTMEGTSKGSGQLFVTSKGVFLGGEGTEEAQLRFVMAANGMELNFQQNATTKIEKIK